VEDQVPGVEARGREPVAREDLVRARIQEQRPLRERPVERLVVEARGEVAAAPNSQHVEPPAEERTRADLDVVLHEAVPERRAEAGDRREGDEERRPRAAEAPAGKLGRRDLSRGFHARTAAMGSRSRAEG
jgi:hypothetical protein